MTMPFAQPFKAPKTIKTPDGGELQVGWTLLTTYSKYGEAIEIWVPVMNPHDINPANMALIRDNIMVRYSDGSIDKADQMTLDDARVTPQEFEKAVLSASMFTAAANYGLSPAEIANHAGLKTAFLKATDDLALGKLPDQDWGSKLLTIRTRIPSDAQLGTLSGDADIKKYNLQTAQDIMNLPIDRVAGYLDERQQSFASLLIDKDQVAAQSYISTLPQDQQPLLLDALNIKRHPEVLRSQEIDITPSLQRSAEAQVQESQRIWQMQAIEAARVGAEMPGLQPVSVNAERLAGTGVTNEKLAASRVQAASITENARAAQRLQNEERKRQWRDLVERARNRDVQKQAVTRL